jgi:hypothetical protein
LAGAPVLLTGQREMTKTELAWPRRSGVPLSNCGLAAQDYNWTCNAPLTWFVLCLRVTTGAGELSRRMKVGSKLYQLAERVHAPITRTRLGRAASTAFVDAETHQGPPGTTQIHRRGNGFDRGNWAD